MLTVFFIDPANIREEKHEDGVADSSKRIFEIVLVTLLFIYLLLCVNTEVTYSGGYPLETLHIRTIALTLCSLRTASLRL